MGTMDHFGEGGVHFYVVEFSKEDFGEFKALSPNDDFISGLAYITMFLGPNEELARYMSRRKDDFRSAVSNLKIAHRRLSSALVDVDKLFPTDKQHLSQELSGLVAMAAQMSATLKVFGSTHVTAEILKPGRPAHVQTRRLLYALKQLFAEHNIDVTVSDSGEIGSNFIRVACIIDAIRQGIEVKHSAARRLKEIADKAKISKFPIHGRHYTWGDGTDGIRIACNRVDSKVPCEHVRLESGGVQFRYAFPE